MAAAPRIRRHETADQARYRELKRLAQTQRWVLAGTPGKLAQRARAGKRHWVREFTRADGRRMDDYLGPAAALAPARIARLRAEIASARALASGCAALHACGYQRVGRRQAAVLGALFNRRLFEAGLVLAGAQAYGALLNELGIVAPAARAATLALARARPLALAVPHSTTLQGLLNETGLGFIARARRSARRPAVAFVADGLQVQLVAPGEPGSRALPVPELGAHALPVPLLDFLVAEPIDSVILGASQAIPVRIPAPERFALHGLLSSGREALRQAAVLAGALEQRAPGRLSAAFARLPAPARSAVRRGARAAAKLLPCHPEAAAALARIGGRSA